jgi:hypothetical protein
MRKRYEKETVLCVIRIKTLYICSSLLKGSGKGTLSEQHMSRKYFTDSKELEWNNNTNCTNTLKLRGKVY